MEIGLLMFLGIPLLVLLLGAVLTGMAFGFSALLFKLFGRASGLDRLGELYPVANPPVGMMFKRQYAAVGQVYYKNSADVCICPEGLYLWVRPFLGKYKPVLIPWREFKESRKAILYWQQAVRLTVGNPPVSSLVFKRGLFREMMPYLTLGDVWGN